MTLRRTAHSFSMCCLALLAGACSPQMTPSNIKNKHDMSVSDAGGDAGPTFVDMARNTTSCAGGGSMCASGNPGACDPGTVTCNGTLAVCTPDSQVQDCYDGPSGTQGVGICKSGTQSCVGTLGACQGQVMPAMLEDCSNDLDDDCDGKVNNGCPDTLGTGTPRPLTLTPSTPPGNANQESLDTRCPQDAFVVRTEIQYYDPQFSIAGLKFYCAKATLARPTSGNIYTVGTTAVLPQPYGDFISSAALTTGTTVDVNCGPGLRAIISQKGHYDSGGYTGTSLHCGIGTATKDAMNQLTIAFNPTGTDVGYTYNLSGTDVSWSCNPNEVLIGWKGKASGSVDQLQPICAPLEPRYKP